MRKVILVVLAALFVSACSTAQLNKFQSEVADAEARTAAVAQSIRAGIKVAVADIQAASTFICGQLPVAQQGFVSVVAVAGPNPGPKTTQNLNAANAAIYGVGQYCSGSRGNGTQVILAAWNGLKAAKSFINSAGASATP